MKLVPVIPMRKSGKLREAVDRTLYRLRNVVKRWFNNLENACRVGTRYDKTAETQRHGGAKRQQDDGLWQVIVHDQVEAQIRLAAAISNDKAALPEPVRGLGTYYFEQIETLSARVAGLDRQMRKAADEADSTRRLQTMPGVGPITAIAIETFAPAMTVFRRSRDFAAWLGLVPRQHSTGGNKRLGATSKMGQRDIRRLLFNGAMAVVQHASRKGGQDGSWLGRMLSKKSRMLVAIALANKMARGLWAMITTNKDFKNPATAAA